MAKSNNFQITPFAGLPENAELNFPGLYLHNIYSGPNPNRATIVKNDAATGWGSTSVVNWAIYDGAGQGASLVGRAHGLQINAGRWHTSITLEFQSGRFQGSMLQLMGLSASVEKPSEWSITGGTGNLAMARGVVKVKFHEKLWDGDAWELNFHGYCRIQSLPALLTKAGPWGGNGGSSVDQEQPWRIQTMTIVHEEYVSMFSCTYLDLSGESQSTGPWGGGNGIRNKVELGPGEILKAVSGTFVYYNGETVIQSLKFVTSEEEYGPYGRTTGQPFSVVVPEGQTIIGFFGRADDKTLTAFGVYMV